MTLMNKRAILRPILLAVAYVLLMAGCTANPTFVTQKKVKILKPKVKLEATPGKTMHMVCSYYGSKFHGRPTASGEVFDMHKMTCAHLSLPFGTMLRVTDEATGKSVEVKVNDRGPHVEGRDLDLSYAAAKQIGLIGAGVKEFLVEILE